MGIVWIIAIIAFGILESVTAQFISIWFAGGGLAALIAYLAGAGELTQWIVFVVVTAILLILTRPLAKRLTKTDISKTGTDILLGKTAVMTQDTDVRGESGEAKVEGKLWTAHSADGQQILKDTVVTIEKIEGVKLIVRK